MRRVSQAVREAREALAKEAEIEMRAKRLGKIQEVNGALVVTEEDLPFGDPRSFPGPERDAWLAEQKKAKS
jgi:hypothetical protein